MAGEIPDPVIVAAPVETPAPAPVAAPEPVVAAPEAPAAPVEPVVAAPEAPAAPVEPAKPEDAPPESLLAVKPPEKPVEKPADKPAEVAAEAKPGEKPAEPVVEAPPEKIEWKIELPETLKADEPTLAKFTGALDGLFKADTRDAAVKDLIGLHNDAMKTYAEQVSRDQHVIWNKTRRDWQNKVKADPAIGGAGHETAMKRIAYTRDALISDAKPGTEQYEQDVKEFNDFLEITGAGDHKIFNKMLYRGARYVMEPSAPAPGAKPTKTNGVNPNRAGSLYSRGPSTPSGGR